MAQFLDAANEPLLDVQHLSVTFGGLAQAVDDVSFSIARGETLGLVGEFLLFREFGIIGFKIMFMFVIAVKITR